MAVTDLVLGRSLASDEEREHRVGVLAGIPMLGLNALGSAAYRPEEALIKAYLLFSSFRRIFVINVPWYLSAP